MSRGILDRMTVLHSVLPPVGARLHLDTRRRGSRIRARIRWTDPLSRERRSHSVTVDDDIAAHEFFELIRTNSNRTIDPFITLSDYAHAIGDRFLRGVDPTSTAAGYQAGLHLRVLPMLGHIRVRAITTGLVDRAIDNWEPVHSRSTLKNTIAGMTRVLDEAVRDDLIARNPVRDRAGRRYRTNLELPHTKLIPGPDDVVRIAEACTEIHPSYADHVMLSAFLAARSSEVGGLLVGDVDWASKVVTIERQCFPGTGGLSIKPPKGRRARRVPIIELLEPMLRRLTTRRSRNLPLLRGPRGGVITTASLRDATDWDELVASLGLPGLRRHDLRHAGATWFANAGVPIHVVSDILGHASIETTRAYLHTDDTALQNAAARMNEHLREVTLSS
jgi:integrase